MGVRHGFDAYHLADHAIGERVWEPGNETSTYRQVVPDPRERRCGGWHRDDHANAPARVVLFVVVGGGITMELLVPVVAALGNGAEGASGRGALGLFLVASIHLALMFMVTRVAGTMVAGWQVFGLAGSSGDEDRTSTDSAPAPPPG